MIDMNFKKVYAELEQHLKEELTAYSQAMLEPPYNQDLVDIAGLIRDLHNACLRYKRYIDMREEGIQPSDGKRYA